MRASHHASNAIAYPPLRADLFHACRDPDDPLQAWPSRILLQAERLGAIRPNLNYGTPREWLLWAIISVFTRAGLV
jgi:hypothetical protein